MPEHVNSTGDPYAVSDFSFTEYFPTIQKFIDTKLSILKKIPIIKKIVKILFYKKNIIILIYKIRMSVNFPNSVGIDVN